MTGKIVWILVSIVIAQIFHELGWCIAKMQWNWLITSLTYKFKCLIDTQIC